MKFEFSKSWKIALFLLLSISIFICCVNSSATATPGRHLQRGDQLAQELINKIHQDKQSTGAKPFYQGNSQGSGNSHSDVMQMLQEKHVDFKIDLEHDPLLKGAERIMADPLKIIGGQGTRVVQSVPSRIDETLSCEEPGEDAIEMCTRDLNVKVIKTKVTKESIGYFNISKCSVGEIDGHYIPCADLRQAFYRGKRAVGWRGRAVVPGRTPKQPPFDINAELNITAAYKACVNELKANKRRSCRMCAASLSPLPCQVDQIQTVTLLKHPQNAQKLHMNLSHLYVCPSGRFEYRYQPLIKITYEEEKIDILPDEWSSTCPQLEEKVDQGICSYGTKSCPQGKQTRTIEGMPITRDCWQEHYTYRCAHPCKNNCGPLRARGCTQINSACKKMIANTCVVYTQTYQCKGNSIPREMITGGSTPFCLDGNCRDQGFEANDEMMSSIAQLALLKEMKGQLWNGTLFKGSDNRCSKCIISFKDCCGSGKGWGVDLGLAGCSADEKALQLKRQKGLCHFVGTYCSEKIPIIGTCIKKKSTYCCFGSKLLKAFHEQGRPQIGLNWGTSEVPLCRGFTIEEIQCIDFSKLDLKEVFEDLMKTFKPGKAEGISQKINERLEIMKKGIRPKTEPQVKQRDSA